MTRRRSTSPLTLLLILLAAAIVLGVAVFRTSLGGLLWQGLGPIVSVRNSLSGGEVAALRAELASTTAALAERDLLVRENAQLRAELGRAQGRAAIAAEVIERPPATPYDTLMVDAGSAQGVALGQRVSAGGVALGIVDEVLGSTARVVLYSSPGQSYPAVITTAAAAVPATVEGQGGGSLSARVPSGTPVAVGDRVELSGGSLVGSIVGVVGEDTDTFKTIYLRLPLNPLELRYVYIQP